MGYRNPSQPLVFVLAVFDELAFQYLSRCRSAHRIVGFIHGRQTSRVNAGVARRETTPSIDGCPDLTGGQVLADESSGLGSALPRHFGHVTPQQPLVFPALLGVVVFTQGLADPVVNVFPAVPRKMYFLACF